MQEQVLDTLRNTTQEVMGELGQNRESALKTKKELVPLAQKLQGLNGNVKVEVQENMDALIQKYTE